MTSFKVHGFQAAVGLILGGLVAGLIEIAKPNELGMLLYIMLPTLLYAGAIGFGFTGFIGTIIGFLSGSVLFNHEIVLWVVRTAQFLIPLVLLTVLFYAKSWRSNKRLNDEGIILTATFIVALLFIGFVVVSKSMGRNIEATIEDGIVVGLQQLRGAHGEHGHIDPSIEYYLTIADKMIPIIKNTIIGATIFLWMLWHEICFRIAKDVLKRSHRLSVALSIREPKVYLWHSGLLIIALVAIMGSGITRFIACNVAILFLLSYVYSGFRQMSDWIGKRVYLRIGVLILLYFLSVPMLIVLIIMGIKEQIKMLFQYRINKK